MVAPEIHFLSVCQTFRCGCLVYLLKCLTDVFMPYCFKVSRKPNAFKSLFLYAVGFTVLKKNILGTLSKSGLFTTSAFLTLSTASLILWTHETGQKQRKHWEIVFNTLDKCRGHVARNLLDVIRMTSMLNKIFTKAWITNGPCLGNKNGPFFFNINE